jgi:AraC family transcriptional regulator, positive regulator of tynA and feaB
MSTTESWVTGAGADDRVAQWGQMLSATHLPWTVNVPAQRPGQRFEASVRRWWIDDLALVDCECDPCSGTRQRRQVTDTEGEFVVVLITRSGTETVTQAGSEVNLRAGDAVVWDSTKPARFAVWEPLTKRSLLIPRAALDEVGGRAWVNAGVTLDGGAPATRLLTHYLETLSQVLPQLGATAVAAARNATLELFLGAVRGNADVQAAGSVAPALRAAMDRFIERHLLDAGVGPTTIASAHGVSVRTVNRVFNATGQTVGEVVRTRRLARAREELTDSDHPISSIASRWGFCDGSHFSRTFKAHYGSSPRDYRDAVRTAGRRAGA